MPVKCTNDCKNTAILKHPKTGDTLCKECFFSTFESEVHQTITNAKLFKPGDKVAIAASGGKDSTVLKLYYFSTECIYSPEAYRGHVRSFLKNLEKVRPYAIIDIIYSGENMCVRDDVTLPTRETCDKCGFVSSQSICKACMLLEGLNRGLPKSGIGKSSHAKRMVKDLNSIKSDF